MYVNYSLIIASNVISFTPGLLITIYFLYTRSILLVISMISSFYFIISLFVSAIIYNTCTLFISIPLSSTVYVLISTIVQELFRYLLLKSYNYIYQLITNNDNNERSKLKLSSRSSAICCGHGIGLIHIFIMYGSSLSLYKGEEGDFYIKECQYMPYQLLVSINCLFFYSLDVMLTILAFTTNKTIEKYNNIFIWILICLIHFLSAISTTMNLNQDGCIISCTFLFFIISVVIVPVSHIY
jgi:hypothetical protein